MILAYVWELPVKSVSIFLNFSLLDAVMNEPVILEQDDVQVLNKPAAQEIYEPKHYDTGADL